tara:strand:- start:2901 stop:3062 length:162 start_codon:yes stop_codon:yes gene_type:complete
MIRAIQELRSSTMDGVMSEATSAILSSPVPATGCGNFTLGTSGIPEEVAKKSP